MNEHLIAYFSMEIGLRPEIPTYSGGLGILAGDTIKSCADLGVPLVAVTLLSEKGYFYQAFDENNYQIAKDVDWDVSSVLSKLPHQVSVVIENRTILIQAWKLTVQGSHNNSVDVYYLDTNLPENSDYDRTLTSRLYGGDHWHRMCQEIVLGIGGYRLFKELNIPVSKYHMNEGHAAFLILELRNEYLKKGTLRVDEEHILQQIKDQCVFTTHTPVPAGHDSFDMEWIRKALDSNYDFDNVNCIREGKLHMTLLAMNHSSHINGVAKKHGEVSAQMFPGFQINAITNGVHAQTWVSKPFQELYDQYIEGWREDSFMLRYSLNIPDDEMWEAHQRAKSELIYYITKQNKVEFNPEVLTIGFARRFATYKRADLLFRDIERLIKIHEDVGQIQIVMAGKAHPSDQGGIEKIKYIRDLMNQNQGRLRMVFLDNYDMNIAQLLTSGCDVWLNTPLRPHEASGTSGMKATLNGVLNFSILDGWWIEGWVEGVTGWSIGPVPKADDDHDVNDDSQDLADLYEKLKHKIIPTYYENRSDWITMMKHAVSHNGSFFNTQRMVSQYVMNSWYKE